MKLRLAGRSFLMPVPIPSMPQNFRGPGVCSSPWVLPVGALGAKGPQQALPGGLRLKWSVRRAGEQLLPKHVVFSSM